MLASYYLPPYTFLTAQFLGSMKPIIARESSVSYTTYSDDFDIFDDIALEAEQSTEGTVVINNQSIGQVDIPVSEIQVKVNQEEGTFPVVKDQRRFAQTVVQLSSVVLNNPGQTMYIQIQGPMMILSYAGYRVQIPIEIKSSEPQPQRESIEQVDAVLENYISSIYGYSIVTETDQYDFETFIKTHKKELDNLDTDIKEVYSQYRNTGRKMLLNLMRDLEAVKVKPENKEKVQQIAEKLYNIAAEVDPVLVERNSPFFKHYTKVMSEIQGNQSQQSQTDQSSQSTDNQNKQQVRGLIPKVNIFVSGIVDSVSQIFSRTVVGVNRILYGDKKKAGDNQQQADKQEQQHQQQSDTQQEQQPQQEEGKQKQRFTKLREFKEKHPKLFIVVALGAATGVIYALFRLFSLRRLLRRKKQSTKESALLLTEHSEECLLDIAGALMLKNPQMSNQQLLSMSAAILKKSGPKAIHNYQQVSRILVAKEGVTGKIGGGILKVLAIIVGAVFAGFKVLGLSVILSALAFVLGVIFIIAGLLATGVGAGIAATGGTSAVLGGGGISILLGAGLVKVIPIILALGMIGALLYAGYTLIKRIAGLAENNPPAAPSDGQLNNQLNEANGKTFQVVYKAYSQ